MEKIMINKNRGWRGLAEVNLFDVSLEDRKKECEQKMIFSFSQDVWDDMLKGYIVLQDTDNYHVIEFDNLEDLPKEYQQRSVLIKNFMGNVTNKWAIPKTNWTTKALDYGHYDKISHFLKNRNNHTQSDWNCIGIRVIPSI